MDIRIEPRAEAVVSAASDRLEPRVTKLHPFIGAQVHDVDLSKPLDDSALRVIKRAAADFTVLLFRNQTITSADQRRFAPTVLAVLQPCRAIDNFSDAGVSGCHSIPHSCRIRRRFFRHE